MNYAKKIKKEFKDYETLSEVEYQRESAQNKSDKIIEVMETIKEHLEDFKPELKKYLQEKIKMIKSQINRK